MSVCLSMSVRACIYAHAGVHTRELICARANTLPSGGTRECAVYARLIWPLNLARKLELASAVRSRTCTPRLASSKTALDLY